jgi:hypothetical protein
MIENHCTSRIVVEVIRGVKQRFSAQIADTIW